METSPLIFLDNDMAIMLSEQVRLSREEEARKYHQYNYDEYGINCSYKNVIINLINEISYYRYLINYNYWNDLFNNHEQPKQICRKIIEKYEMVKYIMEDYAADMLPCGNPSYGAQCMCDMCMDFADGGLDEYC